jgi:hypothetical protein
VLFLQIVGGALTVFQRFPLTPGTPPQKVAPAKPLARFLL